MLTGRIYRPEGNHPPEWQKDLNPDANAGINYGLAGPDPARTPGHTAYDVKPAHRMLQEFSDDELKQIPVLPEGARLEQGATYVDLMDVARREFTATAQMSVRTGQLVIPKADVGYELWNRLIRKEHGPAPAM